MAPVAPSLVPPLIGTRKTRADLQNRRRFSCNSPRCHQGRPYQDLSEIRSPPPIIEGRQALQSALSKPHVPPQVPHPQGGLFPFTAARNRRNRYPPARSAITKTTIVSNIGAPHIL